MNHPEGKFRNGQQTGNMRRRHLRIEERRIHYIGKEADEIEETEVLGVENETYVEYEKTPK